MDESYIYQQLFSLVSRIYKGHLLQNYFGSYLSMKVLKNVNDCIVLESHKKQRDNFIARCSAILSTLPFIFSQKEMVIEMAAIFPKNNKKLIRDICSVVRSMHKKDIDSFPVQERWKHFPRYSFQLEQLSPEGICRFYYLQKYKNASFSLDDFYVYMDRCLKDLECSNIPYVVHSSREKNEKLGELKKKFFKTKSFAIENYEKSEKEKLKKYL